MCWAADLEDGAKLFGVTLGLLRLVEHVQRVRRLVVQRRRKLRLDDSILKWGQLLGLAACERRLDLPQRAGCAAQLGEERHGGRRAPPGRAAG